MGTKNNPSEFDCYDKAKPDEPMFVLLGRDRFAPQLVREWARLRRTTHSTDDPQVIEAEQCAAAMADYWAIKDAHAKSQPVTVVVKPKIISAPAPAVEKKTELESRPKPRRKRVKDQG